MNTETPDYAAHYEPPSLRWIVENGGNPLDAMRPWWSGRSRESDEGHDPLAVLLAENLHRWISEAESGAGDAESHRRAVQWMIEHQDDGMGKAAFGEGVMSTSPPPGAFQRVVLAEQWASEVVADRWLGARAMEAAGQECLDLYLGLAWVMALPNPDGLDCWDDLTVDEQVKVERFAEALIASRGN